MLPDFDYGMKPTPIRQALGYDEDAARTQAPRRPAPGVAGAAARIAALSKPVNGSPRALSTPSQAVSPAAAPRPAGLSSRLQPAKSAGRPASVPPGRKTVKPPVVKPATGRTARPTPGARPARGSASGLHQAPGKAKARRR
jgi:hypothetical protein